MLILANRNVDNVTHKYNMCKETDHLPTLLKRGFTILGNGIMYVT